MRFDDENIYAVNTGRNVLDLVLEEKFIGTMDDDGEIKLLPNKRRYVWPDKLPIVEKKEMVSVAPQPKPLDVEFGYGAYSAVVDEFFKGLDKLWEEMDRGMNAG